MYGRHILKPAAPLPRLYDSADDLRFDEDEGEPLADTVRSEDLSSRIRGLFAEIVEELEDAYEETQPFVRRTA